MVTTALRAEKKPLGVISVTRVTGVLRWATPSRQHIAPIPGQHVNFFVQPRSRMRPNAADS